MHYTYAQVEEALVQAFDVDEKTIGALRGRFKNLQRLGLAPYSPGSGTRVNYTQSNIYDWGLALSLAEFGIDPKIISKTIKIGSFESYMQAVSKNSNGSDLYVVFFPSLFSKYYKSGSEPLRLVIAYASDLERDVGSHSVLYNRFSAFNLSALVRRINDALSSILKRDVKVVLGP
jgi:hypothetical protein